MNRRKMIKEIAKTIERYVKPTNYHLECKACIANLAVVIYEIFETKQTIENKKGKINV